LTREEEDEQDGTVVSFAGGCAPSVASKDVSLFLKI